MTRLEMKLMVIFYNAKTLNGARAGLKSLDLLERQATTITESDNIKFLMDFLFVRWNIQILDERQ